jgi:rifampicin phosphotransferase
MTTMTQKICEWDADPNPHYNLWTIGNSSEVVPGISPPWFSTGARQHEYESAVALVERLGVQDLVPCVQPPAANWAGVYAGRWALNLAWFNAVISTWQTEGPSGAMEQFISSTDGHDISAQALGDTQRAAQTWRRLRRLRGALPGIVAADRGRVEKLRSRAHQTDFTAMPDRRLWNHLQSRMSTCAQLLGTHLLVSLAGAADYTDRLNKFLDRALPGHDPALVIALTSALRDVESARPAKGAFEVAALIRGRKRLPAEVRDLSPTEIATKLGRADALTADWRAFAEKFREFIAEFGFRGQGEVDPSFADWQEEPAYVLSTIKTFLDSPESKSPYALEEQAAHGREAIEAQIAPLIPRGMRAQYRELLAGAQKFTRMRESSKANWVRANRTLRPPLLELGRRLVDRGVIVDRDDIFWLIDTEAEEAVFGRLDPAIGRTAPARRRAEAKRLDGLDLPEVFQLPVEATPKVEPQAGASVLRGLGVSAGKASGPARVIMSTESALEIELHPGEVLIAPFTDAPWTPLFVPAAAVVVETGGVLSHAATVAREYGIPAVVAVKGATRLIRDGQTITVDGMAGTVTLG